MNTGAAAFHQVLFRAQAGKRGTFAQTPEDHRPPPTGALLPGLAPLLVALAILLPAKVIADVLYLPLNGLQLTTQQASKVACTRNVFQIMQATHVWAMDNQDQAPPSLQVLTNELGSPGLLFCPANNPANVPTNWADLDWSKIDYEWNANVDWGDPASVACTCRIHQTAGRVEGSVASRGFRPGWPLITAGPQEACSTPGDDVRFECRLSSNAFRPISLQWRREHLFYETNIVRFENPDDPRGIYWRTNVVPRFLITNLPGETKESLILSKVQTNESDYYSVAVSNQMGVSVSRARLMVDPGFAGCTTNAVWSRLYCHNNLRMIILLRSLWAGEHQEQSPPSFGVMTNADGSSMFGWPDALYCRSDRELVPPPDWSAVDYENVSYQLESTQPLGPYSVFCKCRVHGWYVETGGDLVEQPELASIQTLPDGKMRLSYKVFAGRTNLLEQSADLVNWNLLTQHYPTSGFLQFTDSGGEGRRFYRLRVP